MSATTKSSHHKLPGFTSKVPAIPDTFTIAETQSFLLAHKADFDTIDYIYVSNTQGILTRVISIKDIYRYPPATTVSSIYGKSPLITANLNSHPEEIAYLALKHGIKAVPIIDGRGKLLGVIPHDAINKTLYKELREDILHLAGVSRGRSAPDNIFEVSLLRSVNHRLPWLVVGTLGGLIIAHIIGKYEQLLSENLILAAFIPLVVYIADAVGTQMEAFVIRDFALFRRLDFARYFVRHFLVVCVIAFLLGAAIALAGLVIYQRANVASVLGLAVAGSTISALFSGLVIPLIFRKMNIDPAYASGPLGTLIQDGLSVIIYFSIASWLL